MKIICFYLNWTEHPRRNIKKPNNLPVVLKFIKSSFYYLNIVVLPKIYSSNEEFRTHSGLIIYKNLQSYRYARNVRVEARVSHN